MTETPDQRNLLFRYLLGVASDEERAAVEEQCFRDGSGPEVLVRAEDELIDDYVRGALIDSDRRLFESHFLCTEGRRRRLEAVKAFVEALAQTAPVDTSFAPKSSRPFASDDYTARFENLLAWLAPDRERAAEKYETIRLGLIRVFISRGMHNAEELADETIDRVARRVAELVDTMVDPVKYFRGVARLVLLEGRRRRELQPIREVVVRDPVEPGQASSCLEKCLKQLSDRNRELILEYYQYEGRSRLENRQRLAATLGVSSQALRLRAHNLRRALEKCVTSCLQDKTPEPDDQVITS